MLWAMELTGLPPKAREVSPLAQVQLPREVAALLHSLARAEGARLGDLLKAALYTWAVTYRPSYGAKLQASDEKALQALLDLPPRAEAKSEPTARSQRKPRRRRRSS